MRYKDAVLTKLNKRMEGLKKAQSEESKAELKTITDLIEVLSQQ